MASIIDSASVGGYYVESAETFTFDNGETVTVRQDSDAGSPLDWGHDVDAYVFRSGYRMSLPDCAGSGDTIAEAFMKYMHNLRRNFDGPDSALKRAMRYARTFHGDNRVARLVTLRGYSQSDWAEILFIGPDADTVEWLAEMYGHYFRGDVYSVESEDDAMGGIFAYSAEEAANIYAEEMGW